MIRNGKWNIGFFNIGHAPAETEDFFGCATLGAADAARVYGVDEDGVHMWKEGVPGTAVYGTYADCVSDLAKLSGTLKPAAALIFLSNGLGAEGLISRFHELFPDTPIAGGTSAGSPNADLRPAAKDASILLLTEGSYNVFAQGVQEDTGRRFTLQTAADDPRALITLCEKEPVDALTAWRGIQAGFGIAETNFECATLRSEKDVNIHMSTAGTKLMAGADCSGAPYKLCYSDNREITDRSKAFCGRENALIIGCAGLKGAMLEVPQPRKGGLVLFLYGEIAHGCFGNLMMTGITEA